MTATQAGRLAGWCGGLLLLLLLLLLLGAPVPMRAVAAEPVAAKPVVTELFVSGEEGYGRYRIPALMVSSKKTVLAFCEGRKRAAGLTGDIDLVLRRSLDQGRTWEKLQVIADDGTDTLGNPCPVQDRETGTIWLFFTKSPGEFTESQIVDSKSSAPTTVWLTHSRDDGVSWAKPVDLSSTLRMKHWTWYGTGPGVGLQLKTGRLLIPAYHAEAETRIYKCHSFYSDDQGKTWKFGSVVGEHCTEPQVAQRDDGTVVMNARSINKQGFRTLTFSQDGGQTWSATTLDRGLSDPSCQGSLLVYNRSSATEKSRWLFSNPPGPGRSKLTVRLSYDEGQTWSHARILEAGGSEYSCLARLDDGAIICLYERSTTPKYQPRITFARFTLDWLTENDTGR